MSIPHDPAALKGDSDLQHLEQLQAFVRTAVRDGTPIHEVEAGLWTQLLRLGQHCLQQFLDAQGTGDQGPTLQLPTGQSCQRLPQLHSRRYVSVFGVFHLQRTVYGSREGQKIDFVPLDNRLRLPESPFSYLLQDWDQSFCVEQAFGQVRTTIERILDLRQNVDSLEQMNQQMAQGATNFLLTRPQPQQEGEILVCSADQKGVVLRRPADAPAPKAHRTKGEKASQKRMATVGTVYSVDPYRRSPEEVVAALFRDAPEPARDRPQPQGKEVWASLPRDDQAGSGTDRVFAWMVGELQLRGRDQGQPLVFLSDGQASLWEAQQYWLPERTVQVLDLLHVTPRLWKAAHVFHAEGSEAAEAFVREQLLRILQGRTAGVIRGLRERGTKRRVRGAQEKALAEVCGYLKRNQERMRYDEYLAAGYPIASGVVEGACRHLVKDRMERAGMHWTVPGAQAMLDMRSIYVSGHWEEYQAYRTQRETERLYPYRQLVADPFPIAA